MIVLVSCEKKYCLYKAEAFEKKTHFHRKQFPAIYCVNVAQSRGIIQAGGWK